MFSKYRFGWTLLLLGVGTVIMLMLILWNTGFHLTGDDAFGLGVFLVVAFAAIFGGLKLIKSD
jgi:hypothetical protein